MAHVSISLMGGWYLTTDSGFRSTLIIELMIGNYLPVYTVTEYITHYSVITLREVAYYVKYVAQLDRVLLEPNLWQTCCLHSHACHC